MAKLIRIMLDYPEDGITATIYDDRSTTGEILIEWDEEGKQTRWDVFKLTQQEKDQGPKLVGNLDLPAGAWSEIRSALMLGNLLNP
jgi:hypothetical protein